MTPPDPTAVRVRPVNGRPPDPRGRYVLLWLQMARRLRHNHALDHALRLAHDLGKPLVVYEGLKLNYPWASARFHHFILGGMRDNAAEARRLVINYWPFVATAERDGRGLVRRLCERAAVLVTDDYPQYIVPAQTRAVARSVGCAVHAVDANGVVPLATLGAPVAAASHLRPRMHKLFAASWAARSAGEPDFPASARKEVPPPFPLWEVPDDLGAFVRSLGVDPSVPALPEEGGPAAGRKLLANFVATKLPRYADGRNQPDDPAANAASGLSWYLHYGHLSMDELVGAALGDDWAAAEINPKTRNKDDFFCRDANVNAFLDEAVTWRDVGFHWNWHRAKAVPADAPARTRQEQGEVPGFHFGNYDFSPDDGPGTLARTLPEWAKATLAKHAVDKRRHVYALEQLENAATHDDLWNAAHRQLVATGRMHNYLRMLWGKKVLEWSRTPDEAYRALEHLNNKYAVDGRDPNSYTGVLWCFGLFDRPWPPERDIFGGVRYMTSESTAKKFKLDSYMRYVKRLPTVAEVRRGNPPAPTAVRRQKELF